MEWVAGLPLKYKFRDGTRKYMLQEIGGTAWHPDAAAARRKKQGFSLPLVHWMRNELKDGLLGILLEPRTLQRGYFEPRQFERSWKSIFGARGIHAGVLWMLLIFELWHRNFLEVARPWRARRSDGS